ncbi:MAG: hypothetical protein UIM27_05475 [Acutalibacteraceae bacterium]|nr:hypothetical protein [Acutalibacteraceae bacterium]
MANNDKLFNLLNALLKNNSAGQNISAEQVKNMAQQGSPNEILKNLDPQNAQKVKEILNNPKEMEKIMNSPQAQSLLKKLRGNSNG